MDKLEDFHAVEETNDRRSVSSSINDVHNENVKPEKNHLIHQVQMLQCRVNNVSTAARKTSFAHFKIKNKNIYGLAFVDTGNLVHSDLMSREFWESIGGKICKPIDLRVGTADRQSGGLKVLGMGEPWHGYIPRRDGKKLHVRTFGDTRVKPLRKSGISLSTGV